MRKIWKIRTPEGVSVVDKLMLARGIKSEDEIKKFLDPEYSDSYDPFLLKDMTPAVQRTLKAIASDEQITVYADYDADAVTAAAVLLRFFQHLGYGKIDYYIPDRFAEGYGMNPEAVKILQERGTKLIITVDCGINAFESADTARAAGIDLIITDHHQLTGFGVPDAIAVVNPHQPDDNYPFKHLTGVGVAFKLVQGLTTVIASGTPGGNPDEIAPASPETRVEARSTITSRKDSSQWIKWLLDLVAIGTVADCQSLLGENRILVKWGLHVLEKTRWVGLKKLMDIAKIAKQDMNSYKIGFMIAPRINAAGRMEHADAALKLLMTDDESEAQQMAEKLEELNRLRQDQTERILSEAREQITMLGDHKILLAAGEGWHKGIVGLVAGRLTEEFSRPVLVLHKTSEEATGSARSVGNFNIIEAISQSRDILVRYGGHPQAAGFTLRTEHIEVFRKNLLNYAEESLADDDMSPILHYDAEINIEQISDEFVEFISRFEPTGIGNPRPRFRVNDLVVRSISTVGADSKHLRMQIDKFGCIGFGLGFWAGKLQEGDIIDIVCEPQYNEWNGEKKIQLKILDISTHE